MLSAAAGQTRSAVAGPSALTLAASAALLFLTLAGAFVFSIDLRATRGAAITGDEPFYVVTAQSLVEDGDFDLRQQYERASYRSFFDHPAGLWTQSAPRKDGSLISPHEPGLAVLIAPAFAVGGLVGVQVELLLITALTFALAFVLVGRETGALVTSWLVTAAVALSATAFVYATEIYPEMPAALLLVLALLLLRGGRAGVRTGIALAVLVTLLAWLGMKYVPLGVVLATAFLARAGVRGRAWFLVLSAVSGIAYGLGHLALFGGLTAYGASTVYDGEGALAVVESHLGFLERAYRLYGLFLDQRFGIGRWAPLLLLVPLALPILATRRGTPRLVCALIAVQILMGTFVAITMMGWWFPGRTLATVVPLFPLAIVTLAVRNRAFGIAAAALAAASLANTLALVDAARRGEVVIAVDPYAMSASVIRLTAPFFPDYTGWGPGTVALTVAWLLGFLLVLRAVVGSMRRPRAAPSDWLQRAPRLG